VVWLLSTCRLCEVGSDEWTIQCPISMSAPCVSLEAFCPRLRAAFILKAVSQDLFFRTEISSLTQGNSYLLSTNSGQQTLIHIVVCYVMVSLLHTTIDMSV
jgi:hypothetical protein